jgi:large subunit ribosomal protein L5
MENSMRDIKVSKLVINIGTGSDEKKLGTARRLIELLTGRKPMDEAAKHRVPSFKIAKGQKIGAFVTIRGPAIEPLAKKLFEAIDNKLGENAVTDNCVNFGIKEYIDISGVKYDPKIGMLGMNVNLAFMRKGLRVALRKRCAAEVPKSHRRIDRSEIVEYLQKNYNVTVGVSG